MHLTKATLLAIAVACSVLFWGLAADAMPMFARKYHLACSTCHDGPAIPRLNEAGYKFRRAGFRMPEQIGQEEAEDFNVGNYVSGRIQTDFGFQHANRTEQPDERRTNSTFAGAVSLYPLTGSFEKHFATETEIAFAPDASPDIENAYLRGVWGSQERWIELRTGIFHQIEGFGASDRPLGVSAPLFETEGAVGNQDTLFRLAEMNRLGAEAGVQWKGTSLTLQVLNSLNTSVHEAEVIGVGTTPGIGNRRDLAVFANQILGARSGIGAYWAHGSTHPPIDPEAFVAGTSEAGWNNAYDRIALFGSFGSARITGLAGGAIGFDQSRDDATGAKRRFRSGGAFVEGDLKLKDWAAAFLRLDYFDPSAAIAKNDQRAATLGAVLHGDWLYATPELQYRVFETPEGERRNEVIVLRVAAIY